MSWLIAIGIVLLVILVMVGIALLICRFELELVWCYSMLVILFIGLLALLVMFVHKLLF